MTSNIQTWGTYTPEAAKHDAEQAAAAGGGQFFAFKEGRTRIRVLPPPIGRSSPFVLTSGHFVKLSGMASAASFNCCRLMAKKSCPVCNRVQELRATGNPADYAAAGDLLPRFRVYANILVRDTPEMGPQTTAFGKKIHDALNDLHTDPDAGGDICDPINGYDVVVTRKGTQRDDTEYTVKLAKESTPLGDLTWIEIQPDLSSFLKVPTTEDVLRRLAGALGSNNNQLTRPLSAGRPKTIADDVET